jgi:hypothetical protein
MSLESIYEGHRATHGVLDSIRFTARATGLAAIEVARLLGLTDHFLGSRS